MEGVKLLIKQKASLPDGEQLVRTVQHEAGVGALATLGWADCMIEQPPGSIHTIAPMIDTSILSEARQYGIICRHTRI